MKRNTTIAARGCEEKCPHRRGKAGKEIHPRERGGEAGTEPSPNLVGRGTARLECRSQERLEKCRGRVVASRVTSFPGGNLGRNASRIEES
ncbi:hypothetical protein TNCV_2893361 [Trichonephila clavipes]|nr:hypothetical protein TNCV_2893361 [Trichonephila clavipes]